MTGFKIRLPVFCMQTVRFQQFLTAVRGELFLSFQSGVESVFQKPAAVNGCGLVALPLYAKDD